MPRTDSPPGDFNTITEATAGRNRDIAPMRRIGQYVGCEWAASEGSDRQLIKEIGHG